MTGAAADLFGYTPPADADAAPLRDAFARFHREHPEIYVLFDKFAQQAIAKGHKRFSADALLHRIRWEASIETAGHPYKINDHFSAYYARLWIENNPGREGFFERRVAEGEAA
jgi:hypothetical protein